MLYQKLLTGNKPYFVRSMIAAGFELHRHPDIELAFCLKGSYEIRIDNQHYTMKEGELAIIGSLIPHEYLPCDGGRHLIIEIGPVLFKEYFQYFKKRTFAPIYALSSESPNSPIYAELHKLLIETANIYNEYTLVSEFLVLSNIYRISANIAGLLSNDENIQPDTKDHITMNNIEKALDLVYNRYSDNITVEDAAALTGYGKSNFCKIFKNVTGCSFHRFLTQHRIENACYYLCETSNSLTEIASTVGFADAQILCRVFKSYIGMTPGEYRKQYNSK